MRIYTFPSGSAVDLTKLCFVSEVRSKVFNTGKQYFFEISTLGNHTATIFGVDEVDAQDLATDLINEWQYAANLNL